MDERLSFLSKNLAPVCKNARVWDFCCGTGMNGIFALEHGAQYVHFSDVRQSTFLEYTSSMNLNTEQYSWKYINTDDVERDKIIDHNLDIIIYHGQFYHARNHYQILKTLTETTAKYICFESKGPNTMDLAIHWFTEGVEKWTETLEDSDRDQVMVGAPSENWCRNTFDYFGWNILDSTLEYREDLSCHKWRYWLERKSV